MLRELNLKEMNLVTGGAGDEGEEEEEEDVIIVTGRRISDGDGGGGVVSIRFPVSTLVNSGFNADGLERSLGVAFNLENVQIRIATESEANDTMTEMANNPTTSIPPGAPDLSPDLTPFDELRLRNAFNCGPTQFCGSHDL